MTNTIQPNFWMQVGMFARRASESKVTKLVAPVIFGVLSEVLSPGSFYTTAFAAATACLGATCLNFYHENQTLTEKNTSQALQITKLQGAIEDKGDEILTRDEEIATLKREKTALTEKNSSQTLQITELHDRIQQQGEEIQSQHIEIDTLKDEVKRRDRHIEGLCEVTEQVDAEIFHTQCLMDDSARECASLTAAVVQRDQTITDLKSDSEKQRMAHDQEIVAVRKTAQEQGEASEAMYRKELEAAKVAADAKVAELEAQVREAEEKRAEMEATARKLIAFYEGDRQPGEPSSSDGEVDSDSDRIVDCEESTTEAGYDAELTTTDTEGQA